MKREEYLKLAFDKFNSGKISAEAYDAILMNAEQFVDDNLEKEILSQDSDEYKTDCRYYVYDRKDNVISDGFCFVEDARSFLNNHDDACFIKVHNYFRDECDKLQPAGVPEIVEVSDFVKKVYENDPLQSLSEKIAMAESEKEMAQVNSKPVKFEVTITETLKKTVTIEADSLEEAEQLVTDNWYKGDYILDADSFVGVEFEGKTAVEKTKDLIER